MNQFLFRARSDDSRTRNLSRNSHSEMLQVVLLLLNCPCSKSSRRIAKTSEISKGSPVFFNQFGETGEFQERTHPLSQTFLDDHVLVRSWLFLAYYWDRIQRKHGIGTAEPRSGWFARMRSMHLISR